MPVWDEPTPGTANSKGATSRGSNEMCRCLDAVLMEIPCCRVPQNAARIGQGGETGIHPVMSQAARCCGFCRCAGARTTAPPMPPERSGLRIRAPEDQPHAVGLAVIKQRNPRWPIAQRLAIALGAGDPLADTARIVDQDFVARGAIPEHDLQVRPALRDAWRQEQGRPLHAKSEDPFEAGPVHPAGRAGVPRPTAAPDVRRYRIDIRGDHVGLHLVAVYECARAGAVDWIEE